jgi:predicted double-glycine peptidase
MGFMTPLPRDLWWLKRMWKETAIDAGWGWWPSLGVERGDLWCAMLGMGLAVAIAAWLGRWLSRRWLRGAAVVACGSMIGAALLAVADGNRFWSLQWRLPVAMVTSNVECLAIGLAAGAIAYHRPWQRWRRWGWASLLLILAFGTLTYPVLRPMLAPAKVDPTGLWRDGVCIQTAPQSCSAAAAVTLLQLEGIDASESILARACLTDDRGTTTVGLSRGLQRVARSQGREARGERWDFDAFRQSFASRPALVNVIYASPSGGGGSRAAWWRRYGAADAGHSVVLLGRLANGQWLVADPAIGKDLWSDEELASRWTGEVFFLVERSRP